MLSRHCCCRTTSNLMKTFSWLLEYEIRLKWMYFCYIKISDSNRRSYFLHSIYDSVMMCRKRHLNQSVMFPRGKLLCSFYSWWVHSSINQKHIEILNSAHDFQTNNRCFLLANVCSKRGLKWDILVPKKSPLWRKDSNLDPKWPFQTTFTKKSSTERITRKRNKVNSETDTTFI